MKFIDTIEKMKTTEVYKDFLEFLGTKILNEINPLTQQKLLKVMEL